MSDAYHADKQGMPEEPPDTVECHECLGEKTVTYTNHPAFGFAGGPETCRECSGSGEVLAHKEREDF